MAKGDQYDQLGVTSDKRGVIKAYADSNKERVFPDAFCLIYYDPELGVYEAMHTDGSGSHSITYIICFLETKDPRFLNRDLLGAFTMNAGDVAASGFLNIFKAVNCKAINSKKINKEAFEKAIAESEAEIKALYASYGMKYQPRGGETAELPDQCGSYILDVAVYTYEKDCDLIIKGNVQPKDNIFGIFSDGQATFEKEYNFGVMDNGHTMARTKIFHKDYTQKYPFLALTNPFIGRYYFDEYIPSIKATASEALLSPTRQWAIVIKMLVEELKKTGNLHLLHGISMDTGGGATKIRNIGHNICYRKNMPEPLPIFQLIQDESGEKWRNMFTTFNCGIGIDIVGDPKGGILEKAIKIVCQNLKLRWTHLGDCTRSKSAGNTIKLYTPYGDFFYR